MAVAAFVVSVLALLVSGYVGWRQYTADHRIAEIEEARRVDERAPVLSASWLQLADGPFVRIVLERGESLDRLEWSFRPDLAVHPLVGLGRDANATGTVGPMAVGDDVTLAAELDGSAPSPGTVVLACTGHSGDDSWTVALQLEVRRPRPIGAY